MANRAAWMRKMMQVWVVLGGIMFFAQCALRSEPYLKVIMGKQAQQSASQGAPPKAR